MTLRHPQRALDVLYARVLRSFFKAMVLMFIVIAAIRVLNLLDVPAMPARLLTSILHLSVSLWAVWALGRRHPTSASTNAIGAVAWGAMALIVGAMTPWLNGPLRLWSLGLIVIVSGVFQRNGKLYALSLAITLGALALGLASLPLERHPGLFVDLIPFFAISLIMGISVHVLTRTMVDRLGHLLTRLMNAEARIERLEDLIPICAHCKKMRNDRGFWEQVETYLGARTGSVFSHGICPDCMAEHWPEVAQRRSGS